eukprot:284991-Hanusia_phi.AAC.2
MDVLDEIDSTGVLDEDDSTDVLDDKGESTGVLENMNCTDVLDEDDWTGVLDEEEETGGMLDDEDDCTDVPTSVESMTGVLDDVTCSSCVLDEEDKASSSLLEDSPSGSAMRQVKFLGHGLISGFVAAANGQESHEHLRLLPSMSRRESMESVANASGEMQASWLFDRSSSCKESMLLKSRGDRVDSWLFDRERLIKLDRPSKIPVGSVESWLFARDRCSKLDRPSKTAASTCFIPRVERSSFPLQVVAQLPSAESRPSSDT